jgi:hypothetical protein
MAINAGMPRLDDISRQVSSSDGAVRLADRTWQIVDPTQQQHLRCGWCQLTDWGLESRGAAHRIDAMRSFRAR